MDIGVCREKPGHTTATPRAPIGTWGWTRSRMDTLALATDTLALATDTLAHPDGHTAESPRTRSRTSGRQLGDHGVRCRYRTVALWLSETIAGGTLPAGSHEHVAKSPGTLPPRRARRVRSVKIPRPSSLTAARRHIHTSKSLYGLLRRNPEIHSRVQIAAAHGHGHDPAAHSIIQIPGVHATEHSPREHSHCQILTVDTSERPRMLA